MKVTLALTTTGRTTGQPREVTLYAFEDDGRLVVVGSAGGSARDPDWVGNLRADPRATVRRGRTTTDVRAREVSGDEYGRLWTVVTAGFRYYATYQRKTARTIPLFILEPA